MSIGLVGSRQGQPRPRALTILMPCLNEAETLGGCIDEARSYLARADVDGEILVADNGSTDGSRDIARRHGARVVCVPERGYGAALRAGLAAARGTHVVMGDADGSYDFSRLDDMVSRLQAGADVVVGNRFRGGVLPGAMPPLHRYLGTPVLSALGRWLYDAPVRDFHCGLRGVNRSRALELDLQTTGMEFASEMIVKARLAGHVLDETPTQLRPDGRSRPPHLRTWSDGWRHLRFLVSHAPVWAMLYPALLLTAIAGAWLAVMSVSHRRSADVAPELLASGAAVVTYAVACLSAVARTLADVGSSALTGTPLARCARLVSSRAAAMTLGLAGLFGVWWSWITADLPGTPRADAVVVASVTVLALAVLTLATAVVNRHVVGISARLPDMAG
jgi:hypothetical protein